MWTKEPKCFKVEQGRPFTQPPFSTLCTTVYFREREFIDSRVLIFVIYDTSDRIWRRVPSASLTYGVSLLEIHFQLMLSEPL